FAVHIPWKKTKRLHPSVLSPNKCLKKIAVRVVRRTGEPNDVAFLINCCWRVPKQSPEITEVSYSAIFPKHGMLRCVSANSLVANTRDSDDLTVVVDSCGSTRTVACYQRQIADLIGWSERPNGWTKLEYLRRNTGRIMYVIFGPSDYLTEVVRSGSE